MKAQPDHRYECRNYRDVLASGPEVLTVFRCERCGAYRRTSRTTRYIDQWSRDGRIWLAVHFPCPGYLGGRYALRVA